MKGKPVTVLRDGKKGGFAPIFLLPNPDFPEVKDLSMFKGRKIEPVMECNGFCGKHEVNGLKKLKTKKIYSHGSNKIS